MKLFKKWFVIPVALLLALTGCAENNGSAAIDDHDESGASAETAQLKVVTSFTILTDMVEEVGGDLVSVHNLVPTGTDPHEYEPLPDDLRATADADLVVMNGLNLEGGENGWLARLMQSVGQEHTVTASRAIEPLYLGSDGEREEEINPHGFTDPANGALMVQEILAGLQAADPENAAEYAARAETYLQKITDIENDYGQRISEIPADQRILVTSERAFQYLAQHYDITEAYLWEVDTDENGSAEQIKTLVDFLRTSNVAHLVVESNVDPRPMQTVSAESGVPIYEKQIYSDEIGAAEARTYLDYLTHNLDVITGALSTD